LKNLYNFDSPSDSPKIFFLTLKTYNKLEKEKKKVGE
jgi:hypothetical protein